MIFLTRLNNAPFVVNAELIKIIEKTPETEITLVSGEHVAVRETIEEVVEKAIDYARQVRGFKLV